MTEARVYFVKGDGFGSIPGTPTYYRPGYDLTVNEATINNNPDRRRQEDSIEPIESTEGRFRAILDLTYSMSNDVHDDVRDVVFNSGGTSLTTGQPAFSRWFVGRKYFDSSLSSNTVEVELQKGIPLAYSITYEAETNTIRENLRLGFGSLVKNTAFESSTFTGPSVDSTAPFHGTTLTVNSATVNRNQSFTLSFPEPMSRFRWENAREPVNAVANGVNPTLSSSVIYHQDDHLGLALSGDTTTTTSPQSELGDVSGSVAFATGGGTTIATYSFSKLLLSQWQGVNFATQEDADFQGQATWNVDGGVSIS